jgi:hypothetical protein
MRPDPLGRDGDPHPYTYVGVNPLAFVDPLGEKTRVCCTPVAGGLLKSFNHCFVQVQDDITMANTTYALHRVSYGLGCKYKNDSFDRAGIGDPTTPCGPWKEGCKTELCVEQYHNLYTSPSEYFYGGPNSNTYAGFLTTLCGLTPPSIAGTWQTPGWSDPLPKQHPSNKCPTRR